MVGQCAVAAKQGRHDDRVGGVEREEEMDGRAVETGGSDLPAGTSVVCCWCCCSCGLVRVRYLTERRLSDRVRACVGFGCRMRFGDCVIGRE